MQTYIFNIISSQLTFQGAVDANNKQIKKKIQHSIFPAYLHKLFLLPNNHQTHYESSVERIHFSSVFNYLGWYWAQNEYLQTVFTSFMSMSYLVWVFCFCFVVNRYPRGEWKCSWVSFHKPPTLHNYIGILNRR